MDWCSPRTFLQDFLAVKATAQMNMDMDTFKSLQIPLPSLEHQQQIVDAIDGWTQLASSMACSITYSVINFSSAS